MSLLVLADRKTSRRRRRRSGQPLLLAVTPSWNYVVYAALWAVIMFGTGMTSFMRREL